MLPTSSPYIDNQQTLVYKWRSLTKHNKLYKCALYSIDFYRNQVKRLLLFSILIITTPTRATHVTFASFTNINIVAALQKATTPTIALVEKSTDTETNMLAVYFSSNKTGISCVSLWPNFLQGGRITRGTHDILVIYHFIYIKYYFHSCVYNLRVSLPFEFYQHRW